MAYYIYKFTNINNGKSYVGCTNCLPTRLMQHIEVKCDTNSLLHEAIKNEGIFSFVIQILDKTEYADDAFSLEAKYIKQYNTFTPNGYNKTVGGKGAPGLYGNRVVMLSLEGEILKTYDTANNAEKDGYNPGEVLKTCKNIKKAYKGKIFMFENDFKENGARIYVEKERSKNLKQVKRVVQCDLQGNKINVYESITIASDMTGTSRTSISSCVSGRYKSANNFIWVYEENYPIKNIDSYVPKKKGNKIMQIDIVSGEVINVFNSIADAGRYIGKSYKFIQKVVDKSDKTAYGYKWISQYANTEVND